MSLFPTDDILAKLQEQWKGYADALRQEDKEAFLTMIEKCYAHAAAINAKGEPFPNEALLVSLVFSQYKMINWLVPKVAELSAKLDKFEKEGEAKRST
ncbi:MAG TPA: hypothetical protein VE572_05095 [Nitrososphaeraceae archaeon]|jgi:hypothetical protein|nr:hypothetical protein [Nitrososphaeraceae archaeon]